jgi:hypothetical protein
MSTMFYWTTVMSLLRWMARWIVATIRVRVMVGRRRTRMVMTVKMIRTLGLAYLVSSVVGSSSLDQSMTKMERLLKPRSLRSRCLKKRRLRMKVR